MHPRPKADSDSDSDSNPADYNKKLPAFAILLNQPDILNNIFLFLNIADLLLLSAATQGLHHIIFSNRIRKAAIESYIKKEMSLFFTWQKTTTLIATPNSTIEDLKTKYVDKMGLLNEKNKFLLLWNGKPLDSNKRVNDYQIDHGSIITVVPSLRGD